MKNFGLMILILILGFGCANKKDDHVAPVTGTGYQMSANGLCYSTANGQQVPVNYCTAAINNGYQLSSNGLCYQTSTGQQVPANLCTTATNTGYQLAANGGCYQTSTGQQVPQSLCTAVVGGAGMCYGIYIYNGQPVQCNGADCSRFTLIQQSTGQTVTCQ